ncbi:hypothetical protein AB9Q29_000180 (plasmid) [Pantoea vagans]|uniref:hypothetical protein n=1 Tax=Pantoea vagans TaxID=470934 RepID=UPI003516947F
MLLTNRAEISQQGLLRTGMRFRRKNNGSASEISWLLRSIMLSGVLLTVAVIGLNVLTLREDWNETVRKAEDTAVNLSLSQARQADDTFLQTELSLREVQRELEKQLATTSQPLIGSLFRI